MSSSCKMGFVILHYKAMEITVQAVDAIRQICPNVEQFKIVIVDNASPDGSGRELTEMYGEDDQITVIMSEENLGFAKGNNLGYFYAKNSLHCEYICVMNNDVMIRQEDFVRQVEEEFAASGFAVLGPHITLKDGTDNVIAFEMPTLEELKIDRKRYIRFVRHMRSAFYKPFHYIDCGWNLLVLRLREICKGKREAMRPDERYEDRRLHGCCVIFSPRYIESFDDAFLPLTFMYREEELLYLRCVRHGLKMVYSPKLSVLHLEDVSTNSAWRDNREAEIFRYSCQIDSMRVLMEYMDELQIYVSTFGQRVMRIPHTTPIEVGAQGRENLRYPLRDDVGDNLSAENVYYGELTGLYWIWKNRYRNKYMGFGHYNKVLDVSKKKALRFLEQDDKNWIVSIGTPIRAHKEPKEVEILLRLLKEEYPDYHESFLELYDETGAGQDCNACQMFITNRSEFERYCEFLFGVLARLRERIGDKDTDRFYMRYCAFLGERLLTVYLRANGCGVMEVPVEYRALKLKVAGKLATLLRLNRKNERYRALAKRVSVKSSWKK